MKFEGIAKFVVDVFGMVKLEAIRYQMVVRKDLDHLDDAVKKYGEVYDSVMDSCDVSLAMMLKLTECYASIQSQENMNDRWIEKMTGEHHGKS